MTLADDYIYRETDLEILEGPFTLETAKWARSLSKRAAALRRAVAPARARLRERIAEAPLVIAALSKLPPGSLVADVGGASSLLPLQLAYLGLEVQVFDFRPVPFHHPRLSCTQGDLMTQNLPAGRFAAVSCISVIEHVGVARYGGPAEPDRDLAFAAELARITRPGGAALISAPYGRGHDPAADGPPRGYRIYDRARLERLCKPFEVERLQFFVMREGVWLETEQDEADAVATSRPVDAIFFATLQVRESQP